MSTKRAYLDEADHARIAAAVQQAEAHTAGEIFTILAHESDSYRLVPLLWAALVSLVGGFATAILWPGMAAGSLALGQAVVFVILAGLGFIGPLRMHLVPHYQKSERAHRNAMAQFLAQGLQLTEDRTGVLIFVSLAERYAEIVADKNINEQVDAGVWDEILDALITEVRSGAITDGFVHAIESCGTVLAQHFPRQPDDVNELPDRLVEL
ncbi:putative membrane protein [Faunimonas pinastri]|uniref:Putative membrane protein n=1 Tax=Faunimonas pinastri TaxID=1855383 RepID=A0A1H9H1U4_9HYPH|nr:TPM domain-containing protein [Faunimonas pinastri]SEQ56207.1 putative membrane protein [Faunimonas pinastri]